MQPLHSLRSRLLWFLLGTTLLAAVGQALVAYSAARDEADELFDYHMQQMALTLRTSAPAVEQSTDTEEPEDDEGYDFVVQVWSDQGEKLFQSSRTQLPRSPSAGFSEVVAFGSTFRSFSMHTGTRTIQVAQDMSARREMAGRLALRALAPIALMAPLLMLTMWWVVSSSLAPIARVRTQVSKRDASDLEEVSESGLPTEVWPLVHELNLLFGRVRRAVDAQSNFVADAAHELRSPLAALKLQARSLQRARDPAAHALAVERLTAGIDRATRLVEQLLMLARHQSLAVAPSVGQVDLAELARQSVVDTSSAAQARGIDLGLTQCDPASVHGQEDAIRILIRNLVDNAIKFSPDGGRVDVSVRYSAQDAQLVVEDSGPGVAEAERERVFDRFYRVPGTSAGGSGLGLAIVKTITELLGAKLTLSVSDRLGGLKVAVTFVGAHCDSRGHRPATTSNLVNIPKPAPSCDDT